MYLSTIKWEKRSILSPKLRDYQIKAIEKSISYIKSDSSDHALIKMPTGTGKTIVIGVLAYFIRSINNVLIVSPSEAVRDQLYKECKTAMWDKLNLEINEEKETKKLLPSNASDLIQDEKSKVIVTTIQALTTIRNEKKDEYNKLKEQVNLILFDEGHKEPAPTWSKTIRGFEKKTILFSATPIRNDHQLFNIDKNYFYNYSLKQALDKEIIREIEFKIFEQNCDTNEEKIKEFITNIINLKQEYTIQNKYEPKVIIRFDNFEDIELAYDFLKTKDEKVIAIHDRFKETKDNSNLFQNVPMNSNDATYWLHQNKLVEGIDNSEFAILGIYGLFDNARSLIQQIGRIIRRSEASDPKKAWVIVNSNGVSQKDIWNTFCETEQNSSNINKLPSVNFEEMFDGLLKVQPDYIYETKRFLKRFTKVNCSVAKFDDTFCRYKLPLKANIYLINEENNHMNYETLSEKILKEKQLTNEIVIENYENSNQMMSLIIYSKYTNSPILSNESFIEAKLGLCFFWINNNFIFFYDTNNRIASSILEISTPLSNEVLQNLFNQDSQFIEITLRNGIISHNNVHRQVINSSNIKQNAPNITDKYNFCTTVTGRIEDSGKKRNRYVGFSNSRVSDNSSYVLFKDYIDWIKSIAKIINDKEQGFEREFFNRYAPTINKPDDPTPIRLLLDLTELEDYLINQAGQKIKIEKLSYAVENNQLNLKIDNVKIPTLIEYKDNKYSIKFSNPSFNNKFKFNDDILTEDYSIKENETLIHFLNRYQNFQIITKDIKHIYYKKKFYKCEIPFDDDRLTLIFNEYKISDGRKQKTSEKGDLTTSRNNWSEDSLFYLVSSLGEDLDTSHEESAYLKQCLASMDYLICTDLKKEIADFIGLSKNEVYFIHCKAEKAMYSASVFQEICGQAIKSLDYVHPLSVREPKDLESWDEPWKIKDVSVQRIIKGDLNAKAIWKKIKEVQQRPDSITNVWALTGDMFSKKTYLDQKRKGANQYPEIIQTDYLLMNTLAAAQSVGAKFKFFFNQKN